MNAGKSTWRPDSHIYLVGFMAAGKTTVGNILAQKTRRRFIDTDTLIEEACGKSIADIFASAGEPAFRKMETETLSRVTRLPSAVVALGGGAILSEQNWQLIRASGISVFLNWSLEVLLSRLQNSTARPLLASYEGKEKTETIRELFAARQLLYERADYKISCSEDMTPAEVARKILEMLGCQK